MKKVDVYPQAVLERIQAFLFDGITKLIHANDDKFSIDSLRMYHDNHLTCRFVPADGGVDLLTKIEQAFDQENVKTERDFDNNLCVYLDDKQVLDVTNLDGQLRLILGDDGNYMDNFIATELTNQESINKLIKLIQIVKPYLPE